MPFFKISPRIKFKRVKFKKNLYFISSKNAHSLLKLLRRSNCFYFSNVREDPIFTPGY